MNKENMIQIIKAYKLLDEKVAQICELLLGYRTDSSEDSIGEAANILYDIISNTFPNKENFWEILRSDMSAEKIYERLNK